MSTQVAASDIKLSIVICFKTVRKFDRVAKDGHRALNNEKIAMKPITVPYLLTMPLTLLLRGPPLST